MTDQIAIDEHDLCVRAKQVFKDTYNYPAVPLSSIGRPCIAWAKIRARCELVAEARQANTDDAMSVDELRAEIARLRSNAWHQAITADGNARMGNMLGEADRLQVVLARRGEIAFGSDIRAVS